nr:coniferyl aldehyde dehydrogenase [Paraferrimonas sedimenticola]
MQAQLDAQKAAFRANPYPSLQERLKQLSQLKEAIAKHKTNLTEAISKDFGHRSAEDTMLGDILPTMTSLDYTRKRLKKWMKPSKRSAGMLLSPASVRVEYQPLGVIGNIVPWNFPIMLALVPVITALAAGNRIMLKLSEFTPNTNQALQGLLSEVFDTDTVAIFEGEADVAAAFSQLPFDHLLFTGSTNVGKHVMRAAADNLTPVTLELGGKSPTVIAPDMDIDTAVQRLIYGKCLNAGQICVSPDYVLLPRDKQEAFIEAYKKRFNAMYPDFANNPDYTHVINERQFNRIMEWIDDAKAKGASVVSASDDGIDTDSRKMPTQLVTNVSSTMTLMQEEIFGPVLPVVPYDSLDEAITYINDRDRPLALYIMSFDKDTQTKLLQQTHSGGVCINDTVMHVAAEDAPFGGVGPSGMGHYHGEEGFKTFSKAKTVLSQSRLYTAKLVHPPYKGPIHKILAKLFVG